MLVWIAAAVFVLLVAVVLHDVTQRQHAILRNFPLVGHFRYWLEAVGPELRQYIVTDNNEERPFSRDQRRWIYASAKRENNYFGFGSDNEMELQPHYLIAVGCIQAQQCHTNHCPTGVATQHPWLVRGLDPTLKAARLANYILTLRKDVLAISRACGVPHPTLITADQLELLDDRFGAKTVAELFGYGRGFGLPSPTDCEEVRRLMSHQLGAVCGPG
jgi:glutamate synthase domain-containing protein 2